MKKVFFITLSLFALTLFSFKSSNRSGNGSVTLTDGGIYVLDNVQWKPGDRETLKSIQESIDQPLGWYIVSCTQVNSTGCIAGSSCDAVVCNYDILPASVKAQVDEIMAKYLDTPPTLND